MRPFAQSSISLAKIASFCRATTSLSADDLSAINITGLSQAHQLVQPGDLFLALAGENHHGADFARAAQKNGAVAILTDIKGSEKISELPLIIVDNPRLVAGQIAAFFYREPMRDLASIGVTGTNGKTTVTTLLYQIFEAAHRDCGLIGTIESRIGREVISSSRTTPEATELQSLAAVMRERHMRHLVMEVSSHAMIMKRMQGSHFKYVGFTNLTQDHLDFHKSMDSYFAAKSELFTFEFAEQAVINIDDPFGEKLAATTELPVISLSRRNQLANWSYLEIDTSSRKIELKVRGPGGILIETTTQIRGGYNFDNLLMSIAIAVESGIDPIEIAMIVPSLRGAAGRLEEIELGQSFTAIVDYAHSPDAVKNVLESIREFTTGKIIAVLGCGGDRDQAKRPLMGAALSNSSDVSIFTSDNPRTEDPAQILQAMVATEEILQPSAVILDRKEAINYAVSIANPGDCVVILGKGHELGQEIAGSITDFDDRRVLAEAIVSV